MKQNVIVICVSLISFVIGFFTYGISYKQACLRKAKMQKKDYEYIGNKYDPNDFGYKKSKEFGFVPSESIRNAQVGAVPDAETAVKIGLAILSNLYENEESINRQKPFKVELLNDEIWFMEGQGLAGYHSSFVTLAIQKSDGRLLSCNEYR